jgi:Na+/proline symporter
MVAIACLLQDVVAALTVAYDILVGGLLVPILGGLIWRHGTNVGALAAMAIGTAATLVTMFATDIFANEPIYVPASRPTPKCSPSGIAAAAPKASHPSRCSKLCEHARMP